MVISNQQRESSEIKTRSGLLSVVERLVGIALGGKIAGKVSIHPSKWILWTRTSKTQSCLHVYLPWSRATEHPVNTWFVVGLGGWQSEHFGLITIFYLDRFIGVGRVLQLAHSKNDSCFSGRPYINFFHKGQVYCKVTSWNLFWTVKGSKLKSHMSRGQMITNLVLKCCRVDVGNWSLLQQTESQRQWKRCLGWWLELNVIVQQSKDQLTVPQPECMTT